MAGLVVRLRRAHKRWVLQSRVGVGHLSPSVRTRSWPKVDLKPAQRRPKVGLKSAQSRPKVGPKSSQSRSKVRQKLAQSWPEVNPKSARSQPEASPKSARGQSEVDSCRRLTDAFMAARFCLAASDRPAWNQSQGGEDLQVTWKLRLRDPQTCQQLAVVPVSGRTRQAAF